MSETHFSKTDHGELFDGAAQRRMVAGSRLLKPWLETEVPARPGHWIELGPHRSPLLNPRLVAGPLTFVDGDPGIVEQLRTRFAYAPTVSVAEADLNGARLSLAPARGIVVAHLLNYLDFERFLSLLSSLAQNGTTLLLTEAIDYGLERLFSPRRPRSLDELTGGLERAGWRMLRHELHASPNWQQENPRLLLQMEKIDG